MLHLFDCDGVILDSNNLKIKAIQETLNEISYPESLRELAIQNFRQNFGRTRLRHFHVFFEMLSNYKSSPESQTDIYEAVKIYGDKVKALYPSSDIIPETLNFIKKIEINNLFVVSASDQEELRQVFSIKLPHIPIKNIFGGPESKSNNIKFILSKKNTNNAILYGDSLHDLEAANKCNINFFGLLKFSADPETLKNACIKNNYKYRNTLGAS
tara:strand:- start:1103 stop:1741 length:639 start_codon:yes stop_codon:yes gene_type:complete